MKIKVNKGQYKQLVTEVGGYDDPDIGAKDEEFIMKSLLENYMNFRDSMDSLTELIPGIVIQDRLKNDLGNICHEHIEYYSSKVIIEMMNYNGLKVFDHEYNDINGGSSRYYICHQKANYKIKKNNIKASLLKESKIKILKINQ